MNTIKLEEEKHPSVCRGCLSSDRRLSLICDYSELFYSLLGDQNRGMFHDSRDLTLCWECVAVLRKIKTFQNCIRNAQYILLQSLSQVNQPYTLSKLTHTYKDRYDVTIDEDHKIENEIKDTKKDLADDIKQEQSAGEDEMFDIITKEEDDLTDPDFTLEISKYKTCTKDETVELNGVEVKNQSIKRYQKYATLSNGDKLDLKNVHQYFSKVNISYSEMETVMKRDRRHKSFERMTFKCQICKLGYKRRVDFNRHNAFIHNESPPYRCTQCKSTSKSHSDLLKHWQVHSALLKCLKCGHLSPTHGELRKHLNRAHTTIYTCNTCRGDFCTLRDFSVHYKNYHERFICDYCTKSFLYKKKLEIHIIRNHLPPVCPICRRKYLRYHSLQNHYRMYHPELLRTRSEEGREAAYCVECDKQYSSVFRYKRHIAQAAIHTPPKRVRVPCPDCGKLFSRRTYMNNHYRLVHSKDTKFHCEICNKFFARGYGLRTHRKHVHEKMSIPKTKMCDICGRGFGTKRILDNHRRTHTGERPFKCEYCPASFAQQTAMKTHQKTQHKNELTT